MKPLEQSLAHECSVSVCCSLNEGKLVGAGGRECASEALRQHLLVGGSGGRGRLLWENDI